MIGTDRQIIIPGGEPFLLPAGSTGCLLMHGFTAMAEEMRPLGNYLASQGITVYGVRFSGHGTHPDDLKRTHWTDWLDNVEDGLAIISKLCTKRVLIGQSMGGAVALTASTRYDVDAVIALSTPYGAGPEIRLVERLRMRLHPTIQKGVPRFPVDHPLYHRRELNYPGYPEFPVRILNQMYYLVRALAESLPLVKVPALLIHSRDDQAVPFACLQAIYNHIGSSHKEMLALDGMDHSLVLDPQSELVFKAILKFLSMLS